MAIEEIFYDKTKKQYRNFKSMAIEEIFYDKTKKQYDIYISKKVRLTIYKSIIIEPDVEDYYIISIRKGNFYHTYDILNMGDLIERHLRNSNSIISGSGIISTNKGNIDLNKIERLILRKIETNHGIEELDFNEIDTTEYNQYLRAYLEKKYNNLIMLMGIYSDYITKEALIERSNLQIFDYIDKHNIVRSLNLIHTNNLYNILIEGKKDHVDIYYTQTVKSSLPELNILGNVIRVRYSIQQEEEAKKSLILHEADLYDNRYLHEYCLKRYWLDYQKEEYEILDICGVDAGFDIVIKSNLEIINYRTQGYIENGEYKISIDEEGTIVEEINMSDYYIPFIFKKE